MDSETEVRNEDLLRHKFIYFQTFGGKKQKLKFNLVIELHCFESTKITKDKECSRELHTPICHGVHDSKLVYVSLFEKQVISIHHNNFLKGEKLVRKC